LLTGAGSLVLVMVFGWLPVAEPRGWYLLLLSAGAVAALEARIALGWRRLMVAGGSLFAIAVTLIAGATWAGAPLAMPGVPLPARVLAGLALTWTVLLTAAAGVALRAGLGPVRTAVLATLGVTLWSVPAGEAFTAITALHPAALSPAWGGWTRPSGLTVLLGSAPMAVLGWWWIRPHHPALAATRAPDTLYLVLAIVSSAAAFRYGRPLVAAIGAIGMAAFVTLPPVIRRQRRAALLRRLPGGA
jgi:hypothetical protein